MPLITSIKCRYWKGTQMNKDKKSIEIGFIDKGTGKHQSNTVYLGVGGVLAPTLMAAIGTKYPLMVLLEEKDGDYTNRQHMC